MVSDWLKTQINQREPIWFDFACKTTIEQLKKYYRNPNKVTEKYVFLAKCIENVVLRGKYCQQNRGKWARETKLDTFKQNEMVCFKNRLRWSKKKKEQEQWQPHANHDSYTC